MTSPPLDRLSELAVALSGCLCGELTKAGRPVCFCGLYHGQTQPPADFCDCTCETGQGQAWVRLVRTVPYGLSQGGGMCGYGWSAVFEIGVYRCVEVPSDGKPDDATGMSRDALAGWADAAVLRRTVACCEALRDQDVTPGSWFPLGPSGGCAGGYMTVEVSL